MRDRLHPVRHGLVLGALAVAYGWGLGGAFGGAEEALRDGLRARAEANRATYLERAGGDAANAEAAVEDILERAWKYYIRAHLHAGAIGSIAIGLGVVLVFLEGAARLRTLASVLLGLGALGYPLFWMLGAQRAATLGSTGAAKESLSWLAGPSVAALMAGLALTAFLLVRQLYRAKDVPPRGIPSAPDGSIKKPRLSLGCRAAHRLTEDAPEPSQV